MPSEKDEKELEVLAASTPSEETQSSTEPMRDVVDTRLVLDSVFSDESPDEEFFSDLVDSLDLKKRILIQDVDVDVNEVEGNRKYEGKKESVASLEPDDQYFSIRFLFRCMMMMCKEPSKLSLYQDMIRIRNVTMTFSKGVLIGFNPQFYAKHYVN